jgi:hypothetical protein
VIADDRAGVQFLDCPRAVGSSGPSRPTAKIKTINTLGHVAQLTFSYDALVWLAGAFHSIQKLAIAFWQLSCDNVCASWKVYRRSKKHGLTDLELMCGHGVRSASDTRRQR